MTQVHPVYVVDDDRSVRSSIKFIFDQLRRPCRTFESGVEFLREAPKLEKGVVLLDIRMPDMDGHMVHEEMGRRGISLPVVVITGHGDIEQAVQAMQRGAVDFLEKPFRRDTLISAVERGDLALTDQTAIAEHKLEAQNRLNRLTPRERDVMKGLAMGYPNKTIAYDLGISPRTVEVHRANLMQKLEARNLADALRIAFAAEASIQVSPDMPTTT